MANAELVELLSHGVAHWNRWRASLPYLNGFKPDLRGWAGEPLRQFDIERFIRQYVAHPSEIRDFYQAHHDGTFDPDLIPYGWQFLDGVDLDHADLVKADLSHLTLRRARLFGADFSEANLDGATLDRADMRHCSLASASVERARLVGVNFEGANVRGARLAGSLLDGCNFTDADLSGADLRGAYLAGAILVNTNIDGADLAGASIYGLSAWDLETGSANLRDLVITKRGEPKITVDNLDVAQFIYLILNNQNIRSAIDSLSTKVVLILGRFTPERKVVLDALRSEIRRLNYLPVLFDFAAPADRDLTETISLLAHLARFIVADLTDARSLPQELQRIIPDLPSVPVQPILQRGAETYALFEHLQRYPWVLAVAEYADRAFTAEDVRAMLEPAEAYRTAGAAAPRRT